MNSGKPTHAAIAEELTMQALVLLAAQQVGKDSAEASPDSDFYNDLGFDSLDAIEYAMDIEDRFAISLPDEQMEQIRTPRQAFEALKVIKTVKTD